MRAIGWAAMSMVVATVAVAGDATADLQHPAAPVPPTITAPDPAVLLSRYPPGDMPIDPSTVGALLHIGSRGDPADLPLLDSIIRHERSEISSAAAAAQDQIHTRRRTSQRQAFAADLPDWPDLLRIAEASGADRTDSETAASRAYANVLLGAEPMALAELQDTDALALENRGQVTLALQSWAAQAAAGSERAAWALDGFGIDTERLLVGLHALHATEGAPPLEADLLDVLVRSGGDLTVDYLARTASFGRGSERATATDALVRMLDGSHRTEPLGASGTHTALRALQHVSLSGPPGIREIALEGL